MRSSILLVPLTFHSAFVMSVNDDGKVWGPVTGVESLGENVPTDDAPLNAVHTSMDGGVFF